MPFLDLASKNSYRPAMQFLYPLPSLSGKKWTSQGHWVFRRQGGEGPWTEGTWVPDDCVRQSTHIACQEAEENFVMSSHWEFGLFVINISPSWLELGHNERWASCYFSENFPFVRNIILARINLICIIKDTLNYYFFNLKWNLTRIIQSCKILSAKEFSLVLQGLSFYIHGFSISNCL